MNYAAIYAITCEANGKQYVGSAVKVRSRWASHRCWLRAGTHPNKHLQHAWNKYGEASFTFRVLECVMDPARLIEAEREWITALDTVVNGFNSMLASGNTLGFRHSEATKERLREVARARDHSVLKRNAEAMRGTVAPNRGRPGRKWTDEQKLAASAAKKGRKPWNVGVSMPPSAKAQQSVSLSLRLTRYGPEMADRIVALRSEGFTYAVIAEKTGVSVATANKIARGTRKFDQLRGKP